MADPVSRIIARYPPTLFQSLMEQFDAAFAKAQRITGQHYAEPERASMLGQARHACCEEGFRCAVEGAGLRPIPAHTEPAGGRYSLVSHQGIHLIRSNVQAHCGPPRPSRFRRTWAALNAWLDPLQLDLFKATAAPPTEHLCGMIVVTAQKRAGDPSMPAFVGLGIPRSDLSEWMTLLSLPELLGRYHDLDTATRTPQEAPVEMKDVAIPRLKKRSAGDSTS